MLYFFLLLFQDLEIAADFNIAVPTEELLQKLNDSGHINVSCRNSSAPYSHKFSPVFICQHFNICNTIKKTINSILFKMFNVLIRPFE